MPSDHPWHPRPRSPRESLKDQAGRQSQNRLILPSLIKPTTNQNDDFFDSIGQECRFSVTLFMPASARYRPFQTSRRVGDVLGAEFLGTGAARGDTVRPRKFVLASAD